MILVTGGTGLVGSHLLFHLLSSGLTVKAIYRDKCKLELVKKVFSYYAVNSENLFEKIIWLEADINHIPSLEEAFKEITHVYHCAAYISFNPSNFKILQKSNKEGTENIVNFCIDKNIQKLCYVSSIATIGMNTTSSMASEDDEGSEPKLNVYAQTKYMAEMEVWRASQEGLDVVIVNPGIILGPGFWKKGSGKLFKKVADGLNYYPLGGSGFVTVNDVVKMMTKLMDSNIKNERFIAVDKNLSYKEILSHIAREFNMTEPQRKLKFWELEILWRLDWLWCFISRQKRSLYRTTVQSLRRREIYNNQKARNLLNFEYELMAEAIYFNCMRFKEAYPGKFS